MKVYISSTPDFEQDKLKDVLDTLNLTDYQIIGSIDNDILVLIPKK